MLVCIILVSIAVPIHLEGDEDDEKMVNANTLRHDVNSSLLIGQIGADDVIKPRV